MNYVPVNLSQLRSHVGSQQTAGATVASPGADAATGGHLRRYYVAYAAVSRNSGGTNHVELKAGSRVLLSTRGITVGGPFITNPGEALTIAIGADTTGDWHVSYLELAGPSVTAQAT